MLILVAGASGFIGRALVPALRDAGHEVRRLVRNRDHGPDTVRWNPAAHELDSMALTGVDVVINLCGENVAAGRWTAVRRDRILRSRVDATSTLIEAITRSGIRPALMLNASAVGFYGDRGDEPLTEASDIGHGFLPEVCLAWETHADRAARLGIRTARLRLGVVLAADGGVLGRMLPLFRVGLGGRLGSGRQWMSWVARQDVIGVIVAALTDERYIGPLNVVAPYLVTNAEFAAALGCAVHRPAAVPVPAWVLRLAFGQMADEALLASGRAVPKKLETLGYTFRHPTIEDALTAIL